MRVSRVRPWEGRAMGGHTTWSGFVKWIWVRSKGQVSRDPYPGLMPTKKVLLALGSAQEWRGGNDWKNEGARVSKPRFLQGTGNRRETFLQILSSVCLYTSQLLFVFLCNSNSALDAFLVPTLYWYFCAVCRWCRILSLLNPTIHNNQKQLLVRMYLVDAGSCLITLYQ